MCLHDIETDIIFMYPSANGKRDISIWRFSSQLVYNLAFGLEIIYGIRRGTVGASDNQPTKGMFFLLVNASGL